MHLTRCMPLFGRASGLRKVHTLLWRIEPPDDAPFLSRLTRASPTTTCGIIWSSPRRVTAKHLNRSTSCWHRCQLKLNNLKWWMKEIFTLNYNWQLFTRYSRFCQLISEMEGELCRPEAEGCAADWENVKNLQLLVIPKSWQQGPVPCNLSGYRENKLSCSSRQSLTRLLKIWGRPSRLVSPIKDTKLTRNLAFKPIFPLLLLFELWTYHLWNILSVQSGRTIHLPFINAPKQCDYVEAYYDIIIPKYIKPMPICKTCSWWINDCMKTLCAIYSLYCCLGPSGVSSSFLCSLSTWICRENLKMTKSKDCKTLVRDTDLKFLRAFFAKSFTGGGGSLKLATAVAFTSCSALICRTAAAVFIWRKHWLVDFVYLRTFCICVIYIWYTGMSYLISLNIMLFKK